MDSQAAQPGDRADEQCNPQDGAYRGRIAMGHAGEEGSAEQGEGERRHRAAPDDAGHKPALAQQRNLGVARHGRDQVSRQGVAEDAQRCRG